MMVEVVEHPLENIDHLLKDDFGNGFPFNENEVDHLIGVLKEVRE